MNVSRTAQATVLAAIGAAITGGCSSQSLSGVCPTPLELAPMLVYPKSGLTIGAADAGVILYGNVGPATVPITVVGAKTIVDTLPTSLPSPLPSPTATPPSGRKSWGQIHAAEIRPLLRSGEYDVDATVTQYSCTTQRQIQVKIGSFKLI